MKIAKMPDGSPEIYPAVQGEGVTIGKPMTFVRLSNCNLQCSWCDTSYSWNFDDLKRENPHDTDKPVKRCDFQMSMTVEEVADYIEKVSGKTKNAVFTGGEPLLQQDDVMEVIKILKSRDPYWYFEIETNGTMKMKDALGESLDQINSSPKLVSSGNNPFIKNRPEAIKQLYKFHLDKNTPLCFKFVVMMEHWEEDLKEIEEWLKFHEIPRDLVYLMPEGIERERIEEGTKFLEELCMERGYQVTTRLQVILHGNKRAV